MTKTELILRNKARAHLLDLDPSSGQQRAFIPIVAVQEHGIGAVGILLPPVMVDTGALG